MSCVQTPSRMAPQTLILAFLARLLDLPGATDLNSSEGSLLPLGLGCLTAEGQWAILEKFGPMSSPQALPITLACRGYSLDM